MPLPGEYLYIHTTNKVILMNYTWSRGGFRPGWTRRWPAYQNGLIERGTVAYGDHFATLCNQYKVDVLSGFYQAHQDNPLVNFRRSMWATTKLGNVKLCHMFGLEGFPGTRAQIQAEVISWAADMQSPKYARIRTANGETLPIVLFWGNQYVNNYAQFVDMLGVIRTELARRVGKVFLISTEHICGLAGANVPGAVQIMNAIDAVYNHACGLPWDTCAGCNKTGVEWNAAQSATQLTKNLTGQAAVVQRFNKYFIPGTMPSFDRDLFGSAPQGRVVAKSPAELRQLLNTAKSFARPIFSDSQILPDGEHIYEDVWTAVTSGQEWEEGSTVEPSLVRGTAYTAPNWDYGNDRMVALSEVFRDTVKRIPAGDRPIEPRADASA